ncbi:MAG: hypothetical protein ACYCUV_09420 [Phycisphaerae bacterium]
MKKIAVLSNIDKGAAMLAWYELAIREYPEGLVTQAQAARMLNISRMAVSRLVSRGHLRAVYFPKPPDVEGLPVGNDDPFWLKLMAVFDRFLGSEYEKPIVWPEASFVAFADVKRLWEGGELDKQCQLNWLEVLGVSKPRAVKASEKRK